MKLDKRRVLIVIIIIVLLILIGIIISIVFKPKEEEKMNSYMFGTETVELPGTVTYQNDKLVAKHCLDDICIENATFYYNDSEGRVEYTITNTSRDTKSGYLKMVFGDQTLTVVYKDLGPKKTIKSRNQYIGIEIKDKSDYTLRKLTKEEISKIKK